MAAMYSARFASSRKANSNANAWLMSCGPFLPMRTESRFASAPAPVWQYLVLAWRISTSHQVRGLANDLRTVSKGASISAYTSPLTRLDVSPDCSARGRPNWLRSSRGATAACRASNFAAPGSDEMLAVDDAAASAVPETDRIAKEAKARMEKSFKMSGGPPLRLHRTIPAAGEYALTSLG